MVYGREMTVKEAAALVGTTPSAIYSRLYRTADGDLQGIVTQYRLNLAKTRKSRGERYYINGQWLTLPQVAEQLGIRAGRLRCYLWRHRDAEGNYPSLAAVMNLYRRGEIRTSGGYPARLHKVGGRYMTQAEAAAACGVKLNSFRVCVKRRGGVAEAVAFYEKRAEKRAMNEILKILGV